MGKALGFFEVSGVVPAIDALDIMCKSAEVEFVTWEKKLGGRLVTIIIRGEVSAVKSAIDNAYANCIKKPAVKAVIANPHEEIERIVQKSADRLAKSKSAQKEVIEPQKQENNESYIKEI